MSDKRFPNDAEGFGEKVRMFASGIEKDPERYNVSPGEVKSIVAAVREYIAAFQANSHKPSRSEMTRRRKNEARARVIALIAPVADRIAIDRSLGSADREAVGLKGEKAKPTKRACPRMPPYLRFVQSVPGLSPQEGMHQLEFKESFQAEHHRKPAGADRLEVFVDLVPVNERPPKHPVQGIKKWAWYAGSVRRSPFYVSYPKCPQPMLVVYWARWAGSSSDVSRFTQTVEAVIEGWSDPSNTLPAPVDLDAYTQSITVTSTRKALPGAVETTKTITASKTKSLPPPSAQAA